MNEFTAELKQATRKVHVFLDQGLLAQVDFNAGALELVRVKTDFSKALLGKYLGLPAAYISETTARRDGKLAQVEILKAKATTLKKPKKELNASLDVKQRSTPTKTTLSQSLTVGKHEKSLLEEMNEADSKTDPSPAPRQAQVMNITTSKLKYDAKATIPTWKVIGDPAADAAALEQFFSDLKRAKDLGFFDSDSQLIYMACNASNRSNLLDELPTEASHDLDTFITELRKSHGMTPMGLRQSVFNMKQRSGESPYTFFYRCISLYYRSKGRTPPPVNDMQTKAEFAADKGDVVYIFLNGLIDREVAFDLTARGKNIKFSELPDHAKQVEVAKTSRTTNVMHVTDETHRMEQKLDSLVAAMSVNKTPRRVKFDTSDDMKSQMRCFTCGRPGHFARDCYQRSRSPPSECRKCRGKMD